MNGLPYYRAYPRDFIEGTVGMPFEEKAAYRLALDLIYMHGGRLPDDARYIAGVMGLSIGRWSGIRGKLIAASKLAVKDGALSACGAFQPAKRAALPIAIRQMVFARDGASCVYCGDESGPHEIDHIHPVALGGGDDIDNLAVACLPCNRSKGALTLNEWGQRNV
jgi:hypothetical protein